MEQHKVFLHLSGKERIVTIPDPERSNSLEGVFYFGQNDFCTKEDWDQKVPSVSTGDVIEMNDELHVVKGIGFQTLTPEQAAAFTEARKFASENCDDETYEGRFDVIFDKRMEETAGLTWWKFNF